ncbi:MAG: preprotein translocase subunit SecB [uncultured bacterium]|nr:MAG: preprotein translocase subunit SecB [uncultured bacterium]OGT34617.1 MAG: protein-export chaperone SecB [Gammaproteobacteria bacterium RIFCSPHIGHO2_02_FULL_39_13]OGT50038.1 MAG: protein-export chaperone SecB [Gammaproteobacteria bacterium RIFCSPHIGHO2_12_FULL_39_24]
MTQKKEQKEPTEQKQTVAPSAPEFAIQRLYVKDLSLETPNTPKIFLEPWEPQIHMDLATDASLKLDENVREVVLTVTVTVKIKEKVAFLVEVKQAGIFAMKGFSEEQLHHALGSFCPNILYPYAREVVSDAVMRAGFPQLYLAPVNFDVLYEQQKQQAAAKNKEEKK